MTKGGIDVSEKAQPLLVIEVQDLNSVPVIRYKGEVVTGKKAVEYFWRTKTAEDNGEHKFELKYVDKSEPCPKDVKISEEAIR